MLTPLITPSRAAAARSLDTLAEAAQAKNIVSNLKGLDTSGVEVDEEQAPPSCAVGSPEEKALLAELQEATKDIVASDDIKLLCLRGRKYDVARAAELLPKHLALRNEIRDLGRADTEPLIEDLKSNKMVCTGGKDADGRAIIWLRLRFNDPKKSKALDMGRLIATVQLEALKDPEVAARGIIVVNDMTGVKLKNLDPSAVKFIMGTVLPAMPVRVGRICLFNPPWIIGNIIFPIAINFMSKKLRGRIANLTGDFRFAKLHEYVPPAQLAAEHQGTMPFDGEAWAAKMVAGLATEIS